MLHCCAAAVAAVLRRRGNLGSNAGSIVLSHAAKADEPLPDQAALPASPALALRSGADALVSVSVQLRTGRLALRAGDHLDEDGSGVDLGRLMQRVGCPCAVCRICLWKPWRKKRARHELSVCQALIVRHPFTGTHATPRMLTLQCRVRPKNAFLLGLNSKV